MARRRVATCATCVARCGIVCCMRGKARQRVAHAWRAVATAIFSRLPICSTLLSVCYGGTDGPLGSRKTRCSNVAGGFLTGVVSRDRPIQGDDYYFVCTSAHSIAGPMECSSGAKVAVSNPCAVVQSNFNLAASGPLGPWRSIKRRCDTFASPHVHESVLRGPWLSGHGLRTSYEAFVPRVRRAPHVAARRGSVRVCEAIEPRGSGGGASSKFQQLVHAVRTYAAVVEPNVQQHLTRETCRAMSIVCSMSILPQGHLAR